MLLAGSDDGVYRLAGVLDGADCRAERVLESGRVYRVRSFDAIDGTVAATGDGLYHSPDGDDWTDLQVPETTVYAVGAIGDRLVAGTRPARLFAARVDGRADDGAIDPDRLEWRELDGFQALPSRPEWRLPRHENLAQVRDVHHDPAGSDRLVAGVEVGGVHASDDGGETWFERRDGVDDDVHELRVVGPGEYVAATGFGLYRSADGGETWTRMDEDVRQRYFRAVHAVGGVVYAGAALANSSTWDDPDADPALYAAPVGEGADADDGADPDGVADADDGPVLEREETPRTEETVTGLADFDGTPVAGTHRGTLLARGDGEWTVAGEFPVPGETTGRYTPLCPLSG